MASLTEIATTLGVGRDFMHEVYKVIHSVPNAYLPACFLYVGLRSSIKLKSDFISERLGIDRRILTRAQADIATVYSDRRRLNPSY